MTSSQRFPSREHQANFVSRLLELLREYNAELYYTNEDDGIHISIDGKEIFDGGGFFDQCDLAKEFKRLNS